jgi:ribosomal protein S18 acetylase RimI-like enzyme
LPIALRPSTEADRDFLFEVHRASLKDYVAATYGPWDDERQREMFDAKFSPARFQVITRDGQDVGLLRLEEAPDHLTIALIELLPAFQRQGIGTAVLQQVVAHARARHVPVHLQVFKVNPARQLYTRLGFTTTAETPTHFVMQLPAATAAGGRS